MKTKNMVIAMVIAAFIVSPLLAKGGRGRGGNRKGRGSVVTLTEKQAADLTFLREEEKLARDVYLAMFELYGTRIFNNISASEQRHMDSVGALLDKYGLEDPIIDDTPGVFANEDLAGIYESLIAKGNLSLIDALEVGLKIEIMDIHDIEVEMLPDVTQTDVENVLSNLLAGSYNHLDAFKSQLASQ
ncbi:MAG: DUF2202 domain-containing protein [Anaerohalosphaera sp.]|nr:DUF2202 domain-containing protein [Anaerohalosphaera sp.]